MYIAPNTTIKILKNVPLDLTYEHTIYFDTNLGTNAQYNYFRTKTKYTLNAQSYQRVKRGWIRVGIMSDDLYDCNYLMFQNSNFGSKWFYAFIKSVEYINNSVSEIEFEIDVMQTWHYDYSPKICFVEREHSRTDNVGDNIIPENIDIGKDYISGGMQDIDLSNGVVMCCFNPARLPDYSGEIIYNKVYSQLAYIYLGEATPDNLAHINATLQPLSADEITSIYQFPSRLVSVNDNIITMQHITVHITNNFSGIQGYSVRNKKLYTAPFYQIRMSNNSGNVSYFDVALFSNPADAVFDITGSIKPTPEILCVPFHYKGESVCYTECMSLDNYPVCGVATDAFKEWWMRNQFSYTANLLSNSLSSGTNGAITGGEFGGPWGSAIGGAVGVGAGVASSMGKVFEMQMTPASAKSLPKAGATLMINHKLGYTFDIVHPRLEIIKSIDEYFDRYGYATKRNKIPNRNVRPHWTYTKTRGCTITGSVPCDDMRKICEIYDKGITFWRNGDSIGNYNLVNTV